MTTKASGLFYTHITIVNDDFRVIILMTRLIRMMFQVVASPMVAILTTLPPLEVSYMLLENIYSIGATHDNPNIFIVQEKGAGLYD
jgi:hypothetical protein